MYDKTKYIVAGDRALGLEFGNYISKKINEKIRAMTIAIERENIEGIVEVVPTYRSLMVHYDPLTIAYNELQNKLQVLEEKLKNIELPAPQVIEIPTIYGGEYGPDIENVAKHNGLTVEEVIDIHTSGEYLIYMLGFTPGFPYLGGMDERIATPRLEVPRTKIKGGSVGIAGGQTGIYSIDSPGGWQLIGWTPVKLYDEDSENPILLKAGSYIKFKAISENEYKDMENSLTNRTYICKTYPKQQGGNDRG